MNVLPVSIYVYHMLAWCPQRLEENTNSPESGLVHGSELLYGCWEVAMGPQQEHLVLTFEPSLHDPRAIYV